MLSSCHVAYLRDANIELCLTCTAYKLAKLFIERSTKCVLISLVPVILVHFNYCRPPHHHHHVACPCRSIAVSTISTSRQPRFERTRSLFCRTRSERSFGSTNKERVQNAFVSLYNGLCETVACCELLLTFSAKYCDQTKDDQTPFRPYLALLWREYCNLPVNKS